MVPTDSADTLHPVVHRSIRLASLSLLFGVSACAAIAGLGDYVEGVEESGTRASGEGAHPSEGGASNDSATATGSDDSSPGPGEGDATTDDGGAGDDGEAALDASTDAADGGEDAAAVCRAQCGGCCDESAVCHGGQSLATCGTGGEACKDCSTSNKVCSSAGACVSSAPADAGLKPCSVGNCTNKCSLLEAPCCKQDQTCGCAVLGLLLCN